MPPTSIAAPMTSRMLPRIEPTSDALTTSCSPLCRANRAMISSGALPKVTLSSPPMPGPERAASSSVARPISAAVGTTPSAEEKNTSAGAASITSRTIASGMNGTSVYGQPDPLSRNRPTPDDVPAVTLRREQIGALARLGRVAPGLLDALRVLLQVVRAGAARARRGPRARGRRPGAETEPAELAEQLVERLRARRRRDRLVLVDVRELEVEVHVGLLPGRVGGQRDHHAAQDAVVLARVDLHRQLLDRVLRLLLLLGRELRRQVVGALDAERARLGQRGVDVVEELARVHIAGDLDHVGVADLGVTLVLGVRQPAPRVDAQRGQRPPLLLVRLRLGLLEALLELREDLVGDDVGLVLELHVALVAGGDQAGVDVLPGALDLGVDVELGQLALALALERTGERHGDRPVGVRRAGGVDAQREVQVAGLDRLPAREGVLEELVDVGRGRRLLAGTPAAAAGYNGHGEESGQREDSESRAQMHERGVPP